MIKNLGLPIATIATCLWSTGALAAELQSAPESQPATQSAASPADTTAASTTAEPQAAPESQPAAEAPPPSSEGTKWEFTNIAYLWASSSKTVFTTREGEVVSSKVSFIDLLKDLKFAFMGATEARHGRLVFLGDLMYTNLGSSGSGHVGPIPLKASADFKLLIVTAVGGYRVIDKGPLYLDLLAGARLTGAKASLELTGPFETRERSFKRTHIGPVVATRFRAPLGGRWGASVYGDLGGFGISSDLSWQAIGTIQYRLSKKWQLAGGWRHLSARTERRGFEFKQVLDGPILVVSFQL